MHADPHDTRLVRADRIHPEPGARGNPGAATSGPRPGATGAPVGTGAPVPEPDAVLVRNGRVLAVGTFEALRRAAPGADLLDLRGCTLTPGLTDAHIHLVEWALSRRMVDLSRADSPAEAAAAVAAARDGVRDGASRASRGSWVRGIGWDPHRWAEPPHRRHLDAVLPDRPALLQSHDLHSVWANGAALRAAGVDRNTPDPDGGRIERDADGEPTGVLRDNAMPLLYDAAPTAEWAERQDAVLAGQEALHRLGFTGIHTVEPDSLGLLEAVRSADRLRLRVLQHLPLFKLDESIRLGLRSGFGGEWIRVGGVKVFLDGALGSRTAWLREPYEGSGDRGVSTLPPADFRDAVRRASAAGLAMTVHAIGDAAVDLALDALGGADAAPGGPVPHRIEHAQLVAPDQLEHPAWRRVTASVQPSHLMTDWTAADRHWGARSRWAFAFASLEAAGAVLALGSDAPVESPDPRHGLYAAVLRRDLAGEPAGGWHPEERITAERALAGYTGGAARAAGDARQGRLAPGSFADLVAWDRDPLAVSPEELLRLRARVTMVGGEAVWIDG